MARRSTLRAGPSQPPDYRTYSPEVTSLRSNLPVHRSVSRQEQPYHADLIIISDILSDVKAFFSVFHNFFEKSFVVFSNGFVMRFSGRISLVYSHVFHTSGQYPTVACLPFRTIGVLNIAGFSSSFSILSSSYARYCSVLSLYAFEEVSMSFS